MLVPGDHACFECAPPLVVASGIDEKTLKREGVCAASLPTTMGIISGFLVQNTLKYLLSFGTVTQYLGYNAMKDFFPSFQVKANPQCTNKWCRKRQEEHLSKLNSPEYLAKKAEEERIEKEKIEKELNTPLHLENEWGITIESNTSADNNNNNKESVDDSSNSDGLPSGLVFSMPKADTNVELEGAVEATGEENLDDLMKQLEDLK